MNKHYNPLNIPSTANFYGYSDRGEFSCAVFIVGLGFIKKQEKLKNIFRTFTCPEHGKSKCDACGSGIKNCIRAAENAGEIEYDTSVESDCCMVN